MVSRKIFGLALVVLGLGLAPVVASAQTQAPPPPVMQDGGSSAGGGSGCGSYRSAATS